MYRSVLVAVLLASMTSGAYGAPQDWNGTWIAYHIAFLSPELEQFSKQCPINSYLYSELKLTSGANDAVEGELIVLFGVQVVGAARNKTAQAFIDTCRLSPGKDSLVAQRSWKFLVKGNIDASTRTAKLTMRSGTCVAESDLCQRNSFGWPLKPSDHERFVHLDSGKLVMDDGHPGLADDSFHYLPANAYQQLAGLGDDVAREFVSLAKAGKFDNAVALLTSPPSLDANAIRRWIEAIDSSLGGLQKTTTMWNQVMTFPDPSDPNEYIVTVLSLQGTNDLSVRTFFFLQGERNDLRISRFAGLEYKGEHF